MYLQEISIRSDEKSLKRSDENLGKDPKENLIFKVMVAIRWS
jgi:hypothetical protein